MSLPEYLPGCFSEADLRFAVHPLDELRAFELLKFCRQHQITLEAVVAGVRAFLESRGCAATQIEVEVASVSRHFGPWLKA